MTATLIEPQRPEPLRPDSPIKPLPVVDGGFKTVLADPPWRFQNRTGKVAPEHRRLDRYSTMSLDDICALPVADVASDNAHLYLWVPNALLPEGLRVMESWGFRYVSNLVWAKRRKDGGPNGRGVGFYFRNTTELILFGVRGSMRTLAPARSQVNIIETRKREHSRKPDEQYDLIEACSPGPFLEMFSRYPREGWTVWGDEASGEAPRGKVHKGYAGGEIEERPAINLIDDQVITRYLEGESIRDIHETLDISIRKVRQVLQDNDIELRAPGRQPIAEYAPRYNHHGLTPVDAD